MSTLLIGAVVGFMLEQQAGTSVVRCSRMQRMRMRVLRRQGESPWNAWKNQD